VKSNFAKFWGELGWCLSKIHDFSACNSSYLRNSVR